MPSTSSKEERLEKLKELLEDDPEEVKGVARAEGDTRGIIPWHDASTVTTGGVSYLKGDPSKVEFTPPEPVRKRTPQERVESLTRRLLDQMEQSMIAFGEVRIPTEILDEIRLEYAAAGKFKEASEVTVEQVRQVAAKYLQEAENKEK